MTRREVHFTDKWFDYKNEVDNEQYQVEWTWIGEGYYGDWDRDNSTDDPLLRFYVLRWDKEEEEYVEMEDASYCTLLVADEVPDYLLKLMSDKIADAVVYSSVSYKRRLEELTGVTKEELELAYARQAS